MYIPKGHLKGFFTSVGLVGATVSAGVLASANLGLFLKRNQNEGYTRVLNNENQPDLDNGEGTMTDNAGVIWEYHNATSCNNGHVTLSHGGYFGIKSTTPWGIPGITSIISHFTVPNDGEFWLLKSYDCTNWQEERILKDDEPTTGANDWRYIRFYYYANNASHTGSVSVDDVTISYSCANHDTMTAMEAADAARTENILQLSSNLTAAKEMVDISPNSDGGEAVRFTKTSGNSTITIGFGNSYVVKNVANHKVELDMKTSNIDYGKTMQLVNGVMSEGENPTMTITKVGALIESKAHNAYLCNPIPNHSGWYHIEVPISALGNIISGYDRDQGSNDDPGSLPGKTFNGIQINAGACVIDNLRLSTTYTANVGTYNKGTSFDKNSVYWIKCSWVGAIHPELCTMSFTQAIATQVAYNDPKIRHGSPFYIMAGNTSGTFDVTVTIVAGYNRQFTYTITRTLTIN